MAYTNEQLNIMKERYSKYILDNMDIDTLVCFAYQSLIDGMESREFEELREEVLELYEDDVWVDIIAGLVEEPTVIDI